MDAASLKRSERIAVGVTLALLQFPLDAGPQGDITPSVTADNPDPARLPTLSVWQEESLSRGKMLTMVATAFPNVPGLTCDSWCYESDLDFVEAKALTGGKLELRHRMRTQPQVLIVTSVSPEPGAVEFLARAELDREHGGDWPKELVTPNLCWQLRRAASFKSKPDPYPDFVKRCFIFTENGPTFLHQTTRRPIPVRPADHVYNNPPWVQMHVGAWQEVPIAGTNSWADYSPDRYSTRVIGAVSRDGKFLTALANDSAATMCQAWHDCMHNNPQWTPADAPLGKRVWRLKVYAMENDPEALLARVNIDFPKAGLANAPKVESACGIHQTNGVRDNLPVFRDALAGRLTFPLTWLSGRFPNSEDWQKAARAKVKECLLPPPAPAPFEPVVVAEQDRGSYTPRKVVFNLTADSRVVGYLLVPKGRGPFPAVPLLHGHGAKFDVGKEKIIQPWADKPERLDSAQAGVHKCYGGRFVGDQLAKRGYVCFATDALNWSDRGGAGHQGQQALAANSFHLGMSFAALIAWEDLRAAEFPAARPAVNRQRVAAMGLSMGCFRSWQVAALSDHIAAGVAICWMAAVKGLMIPGNKHTRGQSAFSMTHPGFFNHLDYPDVASLAWPKPMRFFNGTQDELFPVASVQEAYARMREVWDSQNTGDRLVTKLWDVPHEFNAAMQEEAFAWLDRCLQPPARRLGPGRSSSSPTTP